MRILSTLVLIVLMIISSYEILSGIGANIDAKTIFQQLAGMMELGFGSLTLAVIFGIAFLNDR